MSTEFWLAILTACALVVSLYLAYITKHSVNAAEHSAIAAQRAADAAQQQADETRRANDLTEQARRRGVRAPDATTEHARAVGWLIERGTGRGTEPDPVRLRNVGEAAADNVSVTQPGVTRVVISPAPIDPSHGPTVHPQEGLDIYLLVTAEQADPTFLFVSWDGVRSPVRVPIPLA